MQMPSELRRITTALLAFSVVLAPLAATGGERALARFERPATLARDADLNRTITRSPVSRHASASAQGNLVSVRQEGRGNTLMLNVTQTNRGAVSANASLNGSLVLD